MLTPALPVYHVIELGHVSANGQEACATPTAATWDVLVLAVPEKFDTKSKLIQRFSAIVGIGNESPVGANASNVADEVRVTSCAGRG
jgi:hypothetical protein